MMMIVPSNQSVRMLQAMVRIVMRVANEPARRFKAFWDSIAFIYASFALVLGSLYFARGQDALGGSKTLDLVQAVEGSLHVHGGILLGLGALFLYGLSDYRRLTKWTLFGIVIYVIWTFVLTMGQLILHQGSEAAIPWHLLAIAIGVALFVFSPPLGPDGRTYRGEGTGRA